MAKKQVQSSLLVDSIRPADTLDELMEEVDRLGWGMYLAQFDDNSWIATARYKADPYEVGAASPFTGSPTRIQAVRALLKDIARQQINQAKEAA